MSKIAKAYAISDAKISFVSLVDKAANKRQFLITKAENGAATFQSFGKILKAEADSHFVTGIVYEPMTEDTDGNYMTEEEIAKAAHWFMKNSGAPDVQHCFEKAEGVEVVESYVAKSDMEIEGTPVTKGTWLMTMEVTDEGIWDSIQKGAITGFSMGGVGNYSKEDVDLGSVAKSESEAPKGLLKKLAKALGMDVVEKGVVKENYNQRIKSDNFWTAYSSLENALRTEIYKPGYGYQYVFTDDDEVIREALTDFNEIISDLLASDNLADELKKAAKEDTKITKAGKSLSNKTMETLQNISDSLNDFLSNFKEQNVEEGGTGEGDVSKSKKSKEDIDMTHEEVQKVVSEEVQKAMDPISQKLDSVVKSISGDGTIGGKGGAEQTGEITADSVQKMVGEEIAKAMAPVSEALDTIMKSRALPGNLNDAGETVQKQATHYLHGIV